MKKLLTKIICPACGTIQKRRKKCAWCGCELKQAGENITVVPNHTLWKLTDSFKTKLNEFQRQGKWDFCCKYYKPFRITVKHASTVSALLNLAAVICFELRSAHTTALFAAAAVLSLIAVAAWVLPTTLPQSVLKHIPSRRKKQAVRLNSCMLPPDNRIFVRAAILTILAILPTAIAFVSL